MSEAALATAGGTEQLNAYYRQVKALILARQHPVTGLLPASTAVTTHGDYTDAWVRDNVYSILAVWGLALAYRKTDENEGRGYELQQSVVKLMRGLLFAMMQQSDKVEKFKASQDPSEALHAKYATDNGGTVVGDGEWGHLQIDATSVFLLALAQMTASGLQIVFTLDEVTFIQNMVYYVGRAYRTPDYGIWERGNKLNHGKPELNASSVGMAKAALEAVAGLNLFGTHGGQSSVLHVLPDEVARARVTLESLLPRESASKEVDAALLSIIGYPGFAIEDPGLVERTRCKIIDSLQGTYGCKRFLRDGHQTVLEDTDRLHYVAQELQQFEHIECEWPLFFTYLYLDALFRGDTVTAGFYRQRLDAIAVRENGLLLLPELYYVPEGAIEEERRAPGTQARLPNDNVPLVWAQSLFLLGQLLESDLLAPGDIDPLGRHTRVGARHTSPVQIALIAENEALQSELTEYGIETEVPSQLPSVTICHSEELSRVYAKIGVNAKLGLSGRPIRRLRSLTTSQVFRIGREVIVFLPSFLDHHRFYIALDYHFLVAQLRSELDYVHQHWAAPGRPTVTLLLTSDMFRLGHRKLQEAPLLEFLQELRSGYCGTVPIVLDRLRSLLLTAATERVDDAGGYQCRPLSMSDAGAGPGYLRSPGREATPLDIWQRFRLERASEREDLVAQLRASTNLYEQLELLARLKALEGLGFDTGLSADCPVTVADLLEEIYLDAARQECWLVVRRAAGLLDKLDVNLSDAVTELLLRQKHLTVGKSYFDASLIRDPMPHSEVVEKIIAFCGEDERERVLTQEIIVYLSMLIRSDGELFEDLLTLRIGYLILLLTSEIARKQGVPRDEAYDQLTSLSPYAVKVLLRDVLAGYSGINRALFQQESLHIEAPSEVAWAILPEHVKSDDQPVPNWLHKRRVDGELNRLSEEFCREVWQLLRHCRGVIIGDKLDRRNRIDSDEVVSEMTPGEVNFARRLDHLLLKIQAPEYRHVTIEALWELAAIFRSNPGLRVDDYIALDVLIGHAVRLAWIDRHPDRADDYDGDKVAAWSDFYLRSQQECAIYIAQAVQFLVELADAEL